MTRYFTGPRTHAPVKARTRDEINATAGAVPLGMGVSKRAPPHEPRTRVVPSHGKLQVASDGYVGPSSVRWDEGRIAVSKGRLRAEAKHGIEKRWYVWRVTAGGEASIASHAMGYKAAVNLSIQRRNNQTEETSAQYSFWPGVNEASAKGATWKAFVNWESGRQALRAAAAKVCK